MYLPLILYFPCITIQFLYFKRLNVFLYSKVQLVAKAGPSHLLSSFCLEDSLYIGIQTEMFWCFNQTKYFQVVHNGGCLSYKHCMQEYTYLIIFMDFLQT
jgi:hypothetical protein